MHTNIAKKILFLLGLYICLSFSLSVYVHKIEKKDYTESHESLLTKKDTFEKIQSQQEFLNSYQKLITKTLLSEKKNTPIALAEANTYIDKLIKNSYTLETRNLYKKLRNETDQIIFKIKNGNTKQALNQHNKVVAPLLKEIESLHLEKSKNIVKNIFSNLQERNQNEKEYQYAEIIMTFVLYSVLIGIFLFIINYIIVPTAKISELIQGITTTNSDLSLLERYKKRQDIIGDLANSALEIDDYKQEKNALTIELTRLNTSLEQKVKERTKHLENAIKNTEDANRTKSEFLATISHEIRTPMNAILGISEIILGGKTTKKQRDLIDQIKGACYTLIDIVNDLFNYSKIEAGQIQIENNPFDFENFLEDLHKNFAPQAKKKSLGFEKIIKNPKLRFIEADEQRLKQVVSCLISNALKFTHEGKITVIANLLDDNSQLQITIHDTGIGIPPHKQDNIFTAFSQAETYSNRNFGGTGLGLSIAKHLTEAMNGHIKLKSKVNHGSTFTITIPITIIKHINKNEKKETRKKQVKSSKKPSKTQNVLLVEDNMTNQLVAKSLIESFGYNVIVANDGQKAIDTVLAAPEKIDIILMDCQMPIMDGYEATQLLRNKMRSQEIPFIPIVAQTANAIEGDKEKCLAIGMNDYLSKPLEKELLQNTVAYYIEQKEKYSEQFISQLYEDIDLSLFPVHLFDISYLKELKSLLPNSFASTIQKTIQRLKADLKEIENNHTKKMKNALVESTIIKGQTIGLLSFTGQEESEKEINMRAKNLILELEKIEKHLDAHMKEIKS